MKKTKNVKFDCLSDNRKLRLRFRKLITFSDGSKESKCVILPLQTRNGTAEILEDIMMDYFESESDKTISRIEKSMQIAKDWNFSLNNLKNFFREKNKKTEPEIYEFMRLAIFTNGDGNPIPVYSIQDDFPEICEGFINSLNALEKDYNRQIEYLTKKTPPLN